MRLSRKDGVRIRYIQNNMWFFGYADRTNLFDSYMGFLVVWNRDDLIKKYVNPMTIDEFSLFALNDDEQKVWERICDAEE